MQRAVRVAIAIAGCLAIALTVGFSFIAPGLAIVSAVLTGLTVVLWADYQRRFHWEEKQSKQLNILQKAMRNVSQGVQENRTHIVELQKHEERQLLDSQNASPEIEGRAEKVASQLLKQAGAQKKNSRMPASQIRKVKTAKPRKAAVHDMRALVTKSLETQHVMMFVQPVVNLPQQKTRFYELYARLEGAGGLSVPANDYMSYAMARNVMGKIDGLLLMRSLRVIERSAQVRNATPFFVNIASSTLKDASFMGQLLAFLKKHKRKTLRERLVFEISQADYQDLPPVMIEMLRGLGQLGCAFSLDQVRDFDIDISLLVKHKIRSIKISAPLLIEEIKTHAGLVTLQKLIRRIEGNGVSVIVDKVETQAQLALLEALDLNYAQGYLFGRPAPQQTYARKKKVA